MNNILDSDYETKNKTDFDYETNAELINNNIRNYSDLEDSDYNIDENYENNNYENNNYENNYETKSENLKKTKPANIFLIIMSIIFIIVAVIWIFYCLSKNYSISQARNWQPTSAKVIYSYSVPVQEYLSVNFANPNEVVSKITRSGSYVPKIEYEYYVNGEKKYGQTVVYNGPKSFSATQSDTIVSKNKEGNTITIYYNSADPTKSFIYTDYISWIGAGFGTLLLTLSIIFLFWFLKTHNPKNT